MQVRALLDAGELVALAPRARIAVDLYWHHWEVAPPNAMSISDAVVRQARQALIQSDSILPADADNGKAAE